MKLRAAHTPKDTTKTHPVDIAYQAQAAQAKQNMEKLAKLLKAHAKEQSTSMSYGMVGSMEHINDLLTQATKFLAGENF